MGSGTFCDRCMRARSDIVAISLPRAMPIDLCVPCCGDLCKWVGEGARRVGAQATRSPYRRAGEWLKLFECAADSGGEVTPLSLATAAGVPVSTANWQLNNLTRMRAVRKLGPGRYAAVSGVDK